jgi:ABC-type sulfate transport system permease subunit
VSGAYAAALVLALIALATLLAMNLIRKRGTKTVSPVTLGTTPQEDPAT